MKIENNTAQVIKLEIKSKPENVRPLVSAECRPMKDYVKVGKGLFKKIGRILKPVKIDRND